MPQVVKMPPAIYERDTHMEQVLNNLQYSSFQDTGASVITIGAAIIFLVAIIYLFFQVNKGNNIHFIHQFSYQPENTGWSGCLVLVLLLIILPLFAFCIDPLINPFHLASPANQAQAIVQQFYDDINSKDYQSAYNLFKDGWPEPYSNFANGYKETEYVDISSEEINEQPSKDTATVSITVKATENLPQGRCISTYIFSYTIGKENGIYKILDSHPPPGSSPQLQSRKC